MIGLQKGLSLLRVENGKNIVRVVRNEKGELPTSLGVPEIDDGKERIVPAYAHIDKCRAGLLGKTFYRATFISIKEEDEEPKQIIRESENLAHLLWRVHTETNGTLQPLFTTLRKEPENRQGVVYDARGETTTYFTSFNEKEIEFWRCCYEDGRFPFDTGSALLSRRKKLLNLLGSSTPSPHTSTNQRMPFNYGLSPVIVR